MCDGRWSIGAVEYWSIGVLEYWSIGPNQKRYSSRRLVSIFARTDTIRFVGDQVFGPCAGVAFSL
jgi:hypothetical protein